MKYRRLCKTALALTSVLALAANGAWAQGAPAPAAPAAAPEENEDDTIVELSPFEVSASSDVGYLATDTLAATRIRTSLRDVGSSISVINEEFLRDTGVTSSQDLLVYTTGTEVGGVQGNFLVGSQVGDAAMINDNDARLRPQNNTRVRGLDSADNTRDYYLTDIPWDSYNTSRVDIQRGANSILFGNGSGAGIINAGIDAPSLNANSGTIEARYGSFGSYRGSLNINRVLIEDQLAMRFATLFDHKEYRQDPAFNEDRRYYAAVKWEPEFLKRGDARTSLKVSYENGSIRANRPRVNTINDAISSWFIQEPIELRSPTPLGRPAGQDDTLLGVLTPMVSHDGYDPFVTMITPTAALLAANPGRHDIGARQAFNATSNPNAEAWLGAQVKPLDQGGSRLGPGIDVSGTGTLFWMAVYEDPTSDALARYVYPNFGNLNYNTVNSSGVRDGNTIAAIRDPDMTGLLRLDQYSFRGVGSLLYTLQGVWRGQTITDPTVFDFYNHLIDGPTKAEGSDFDAFNFAIDQTFFNDKVGIQFAFDEQEYSEFRVANLNNPTLTLDIYRNLPVALLNTTTGLYEPMANPNFGRPYIVSRSQGNFRSTNKLGTFRITPYVDLNFKDLFKSDNFVTKILGRHLITGLYEKHRRERETATWTRYAVDPTQSAALFGPNRPINNAERSVGTISYLGDPIDDLTSMSGINLSPISANQQPRTFMVDASTMVSNAYYFDSTWTGAGLPGTPTNAQRANPAFGAGLPFTPVALGIAPNAVGGAATTESENPNNYRGWSGTPRTLNVVNSDFGDEREMTTAATLTKSKYTSKAIVDQWTLLDHALVVTAGLRQDEVKTYTPGNPLLAPDATGRNGSRFVNTNTGVVDWDAPFEYPTEPSSTYKSDWLQTYGAVLHTPEFIRKNLPWRLNLSVFYSKSENFKPDTRRDYITGEPLTPPTGDTKDYGFMVSAWDGKVSLKVSRYTTNVHGASLQDNSIINFTADEISRGIQFAKSVIYINDINTGANESGGNPTGISDGTAGNQGGSDYTNFAYTLSNQSGTRLDASNHQYPWEPSRPATADTPWTLAEWQAEEAHALRSARAFMASLESPEVQQFMTVWNLNPANWSYAAPNNGITSTRPAGAAITGDTRSTGTEYELYIRPTESWNIAINAAKSEATRFNLAGNAANWLQTRWALYNEEDPDYAAGGLLVGDLRWFGGGQGNVASGNARFGRNGYKFYSEFAAREGVNVPELRPWRFNLVTSYNFNGEFLKGVFVGGGYRWEDKSVVGFGVTETDPEVLRTTGSGLVSVRAAIGQMDVNKPFYGPEESHFDLWGGYNRRLTDNLEWRIQLNIRNAFESKGIVPISVNPDGSGAAYRIVEGMTWELTSSFKF